MASPKSVEPDLDRLYSLPLDDFVPRRDRLARALREAGDREQAGAVKALRKPTVAAWTVNQLARREKMRLRSLLTAGERLRAAQQKLLEGGSPGPLGQARDDERKAIVSLAAAARDVLAEGGQAPSESTLRRVSETLHAAALDPELGDRVRQGRLAQETQAAGFGFESGAFPARGRRSTSKTKASEDRRKQRDAAKAEQRAAEDRVREARRALKEAEAAVTRQQRELASAEKELADRRSDLRASEAHLKRARRSLEKLG